MCGPVPWGGPGPDTRPASGGRCSRNPSPGVSGRRHLPRACPPAEYGKPESPERRCEGPPSRRRGSRRLHALVPARSREAGTARPTDSPCRSARNLRLEGSLSVALSAHRSDGFVRRAAWQGLPSATGQQVIPAQIWEGADPCPQPERRTVCSVWASGPSDAHGQRSRSAQQGASSTDS